ncbi:dynamin family protein [Pseudomonas sp. NBRC 111123]|uniref:dynamin family protein n=1 Tax=Pseudomonas sp. NBRC 111123 TaxID=1661038 RepID=UPI000761985D|nr:dynamin family protein [Pseudomonas sp. NBRC 111123]
MHEKNIELLRDEAQRLLQVEVDLLKQMQSQPGVVTQAHAGEQQTFTIASISKDIEVLRGELSKLNDLEMVLAVVGTMKAGKSTTINAIVGTEVLPNRNRPMTALPTLIRHTPGQIEPVLKLENSAPINDLILELADALESPQASEQLRKLAVDDDMRELLALISQRERFAKRHDGADSIFQFLKSLNDLVRLSAALNVEFPFADYDEVHEMPVIEVEFAHLGETGQAGGRLTLLDTPGPNESGQQHLRKMLSEQLKKASAVLAVLDFTQLKSDADAQVRTELAEIASVASGRLFALVNKFDQKDRNGDSEDKIKSVVADDLMQGMVKHADVHPVSSRWGYLANRAKHEVFLHKKLPDPDKQPWVVDFAEEAFGRRWQNSIDDMDEVLKAANALWKDSLFTRPLTDVIQTAHARAATFAVDSAASKLIHTAESVEKFLGVRETALAKSAKVLREQISSLKGDIDKIENIRSHTEKEAKETLADIQKRTQKVFKQIKTETERAIDAYFKEGKAIELEQTSSKPEKQRDTDLAPLSGMSGAVASLVASFMSSVKTKVDSHQEIKFFGGLKAKADATQDFNPNDPIIKFDDEKSAKELIAKIDGAIKKKIGSAEKVMLDVMGKILDSFEKNFKTKVTGHAQKIVDDLNHRLSSDGFSIELKIPNARSLRIELNASDALAGMVSQKSKQVTRYRRETGVWGTVCKWFDSNDWGWESYSTTEKFYQVDIRQVKESVSTAIAKVFDGLNETIAKSIEVPLNDAVDKFFSAFIDTVEQIRGDLLQGIRDQEISQAEQLALSQRLAGLKRNVPAILADSRDLKKDTEAFDILPEGV